MEYIHGVELFENYIYRSGHSVQLVRALFRKICHCVPHVSSMLWMTNRPEHSSSAPWFFFFCPKCSDVKLVHSTPSLQHVGVANAAIHGPMLLLLSHLFGSVGRCTEAQQDRTYFQQLHAPPRQGQGSMHISRLSTSVRAFWRQKYLQQLSHHEF